MGPHLRRRESPAVASTSCTRLDRRSPGWSGCRSTDIGTVDLGRVWTRTSANSGARMGANGSEEEDHMDILGPSRRD